MNTTATTEPTAWIPNATTYPPVTRVDEARIEAFIAKHGLGEYVDAAIRLAWDAFPSATGITLTMSGAPGEYGERLFLEVARPANAGDSLLEYRDFMTRWVAVTPPQVTQEMGLTIDYI